MPQSCDFLINYFTSNFFADVKFHTERGEVINKTKQNGLNCRDTSPLIHVIVSIEGKISGQKLGALEDTGGCPMHSRGLKGMMIMTVSVQLDLPGRLQVPTI